MPGDAGASRCAVPAAARLGARLGAVVMPRVLAARPAPGQHIRAAPTGPPLRQEPVGVGPGRPPR